VIGDRHRCPALGGSTGKSEGCTDDRQRRAPQSVGTDAIRQSRTTDQHGMMVIGVWDRLARQEGTAAAVPQHLLGQRWRPSDLLATEKSSERSGRAMCNDATQDPLG
jgi:hypothetical protein